MNRSGTDAWIIDDDRIFAYILQKQLKSIDHCKTIAVYYNGLEALRQLNAILAQNKLLPDLILLDLNMPVLDGWQFLDEYQKLSITKEIKLYILSSSIDPNDHRKASEYKIVKRFFTKPVTREDLLSVLDDITNRK